MLFFTLLSVIVQQVPAAQRARVDWVPNPRAQNSTWVADPSHHLQPATLAEANRVIGAMERETSAELAVVIVDSLKGLAPQEFATTLHRVWGVGKAGRNNGVLLLWAPVERQVFISVGYGLEGRLPDSRAGRIRDVIIGHFRNQEFDRGILAGVNAIANAAREEAGLATRPRSDTGPAESPTADSASPAAVATPRPAPTRFAADDDDDDRNPLPLIGGIAALAAGGVGGLVGWRRWKRKRPRNCSQGHPMRLLDERKDDDFLGQGEKSEERLKSIDYDVWFCKPCQEVLKIPYKAWMSSYHECVQCHRRTAITSTRTLVSATTSHGGSELVVDFCHHCGHKTETQRSTPRIVESSSSSGSHSGGSSSSSSGSFGGGSAGGGGAGGSY